MRTGKLTGFTLTLLTALKANAQEPAAPTPAGVAVRGEVSGSSTAATDSGASGNPEAAYGARTGFETGLRLGVGVPVGKGGRDLAGGERSLGDLTTWRAPLWLDVGYRLSAATTLGAYAQVGVGGNGDACVGECDWSDIRVGAQAQWRLAPGSGVSPWIGIGAGYEWLSYRTLLQVPLADAEPGEPDAVAVRTAELLAGPELLLQAGIDFLLEDSFSVGPYASATFGQYLSDSVKCEPRDLPCAEIPAIDGAGFHSWLGVGLRGSYTP